VALVGRFADWRPDVVIVMHAFNDIFQTSEGRLAIAPFRRDYGHFFGAMGERANPRDRFAENVSAALTQNAIKRVWFSDLRVTHEQNELGEVDLERPLPAFERNLAELSRRAAQDGAHLVLATQPFLYRPRMPAQEVKTLFYGSFYADYERIPRIAEQARVMRRFNRATQRVARSCGAGFVDVAARVPKSTEYLWDDVHSTAAGAARVAQTLFAEIEWARIAAAPAAGQLGRAESRACQALREGAAQAAPIAPEAS